MKLSPEIQEAILTAPAGDPRELALKLSERFGQRIPVQAIVTVRGSLKRAQNVAAARERASEALGDNLSIMAHAKGTLFDIFSDATLPLKDRIEASKELRQWTSMETAAAGIEDKETDTVFVIGADWDMAPPGS